VRTIITWGVITFVAFLQVSRRISSGHMSGGSSYGLPGAGGSLARFVDSLSPQRYMYLIPRENLP
jgi:hypothetical protein